MLLLITLLALSNPTLQVSINATESSVFTEHANQPGQATGVIEITGQTFIDEILEFYQNETVILENNKFINTSITIYEANRVRIAHNEFTSPVNVVLVLFNCMNTEILDNSFDSVPESAISVFDSPNSFIANNSITLSDDDQGPFALYVAIRVERSPNSTMIDNQITSPRGDGIHLFYSPGSNFTNNEILNSGFGAISISSSPNTIISGNSLITSSQFRKVFGGTDVPPSSSLSIVESSNSEILNNLIDYSDFTGIEIISSTNILIKNNNIRNHPTGVFVGNSVDIEINSNRFYDVLIPIEFDQTTRLVTISNEVIYENVTPSDNDSIGHTFSFFVWIIVSSIFLMSLIKRRDNKYQRVEIHKL